MTTLAAIEARLDDWRSGPAEARDQAEELLSLAECVLEHWLGAHGATPTDATVEGFRLLGLHRQGARGDPSFNACRETCREIAYRYNLIRVTQMDARADTDLVTLRRLVQHLVLFISGKLQSAQLGEFCCASRPIRQADA